MIGGALPIAVDAMGGDNAPGDIVRGAVQAVRNGVPVVLVGDQEVLARHVPRGVDVGVVHAPEHIPMDANPASARRLPASSMRRALALVAEGRASAAVSCGNSGALLVSAILELKTLPGVERPAIATVMPRADAGRLVLLDAGANVDCRPEQLACFAVLGVALARALGVSSPRVGLLSNGEESMKGNVQVRATFPLLETLPVDFVGNIEPPAALSGACDVLVCDGFVGNVLVKSVEGAVDAVVQLLRQEIRRRPVARVGSVMMSGAFEAFRKRVEWDSHGGGLLLGVGGPVVVGHGRANASAAEAAIALAHKSATSGLLDSLKDGIQVVEG